MMRFYVMIAVATITAGGTSGCDSKKEAGPLPVTAPSANAAAASSPSDTGVTATPPPGVVPKGMTYKGYQGTQNK